MSNRDDSWTHAAVRSAATLAVLVLAPAAVAWLMGTGVAPPAAPVSAPPVAVVPDLPVAVPHVEPPPIPSPEPARPYAPPSVAAVTSCDAVPKPSASARVVLFGVYEGAAMSDFGAAGTGTETSLVRVSSSSEGPPLYAALTGYESLVWAFEGDVSNVERVVVRRGSAVSGLPASKVVVLQDPDCLPYFYEPGGSDQIKASKRVRALIGRDVDVVAGSYQVGRLDLPAATFAKGKFAGGPTSTPVGYDPGTYATAMRFSPEGVVRVDPAKTVSGPEGRSYDVLPNGFGISQLVARGALKAMSNHDEFRIEKPFSAFPAGLNGAHSVKFVLAKGVRMPGGDAGHSCILSEETGEYVGSQTMMCAHR